MSTQAIAVADPPLTGMEQTSVGASLDTWHATFSGLRKQLARAKQGSPAWAYLQRQLGDMLIQKSDVSEPEARLRLTTKAVKRYDAGLHAYQALGLHDTATETRGQRAKALRSAGRAARNDERTPFLSEAVREHQHVADWLAEEEGSRNWAVAQINLGLSLFFQALSDRTESSLPLMQRAVAAHEYALEAFSEESAPEQWAGVQHNLGVIQMRLAMMRDGADIAREVRAAVYAFHKAFRVRKRETMPVAWAETLTQSVLGNAYLLRFENDDAGTVRALEEMVAALNQVLKIYGREAPQRCPRVEELRASLTEALAAMEQKQQRTGT